jgi:hypothetical protein
MSFAVLAVRFGLAALFAWAALAKGLDPWAFAEGIGGFQIFPDRLIPLLALTVPWVELAAAVLMATPRWRQGALLAVLLSAVFLLLFLWAGVRGLEVRCACFGAADFLGSSVPWGLARATVLLLGSGWLYRWRARG